jgi:general secretion pathway protein F
MPVYEYNALDQKGKSVTGIMDAESASVARQKLRGAQIFPVSIKEVDKATAASAESSFKTIRLFDRVRTSDISMMTRQLATLLDAGFPLVGAMDTLIVQVGSTSFKKIITQIKTSVVEGSSFADALSAYPNVFSQLYINMVHAGETSGTLEIVLERLADITEKQQALASRIRAIMTYPVIMAILGSAVLLFLLTVIVPNITSIFSDMDRVLPAPTRFLIATSDFLKSYWWFILILMIAAFFIVHTLKKTTKGRLVYDKFMLRIPLFGALKTKLAVARFSRTLASLLENGVALLTALDIVKNVVGNKLISNAIEKAGEEVGKGEGLSKSLSAHSSFPYLTIQMIQVGEQSGELEAMLNKIADVYENDSENTILSMTSILEPAMIVFMAVTIGMIVIAIMLPIIEMNQLIV